MRLLIIGLLFTLNSFGQENAEKPSGGFTKENAFVGGSATTNFSIFQANSGQVLIGVNPMYGYYLKNWLDVAGVLNLQYNNFETEALLSGRKKSSFLAGLGVSSRIYPVDFLYLQVQPELNMIFAKEQSIFGGGGVATKSTRMVPSMLVGAGMKRGFQKGRTFYWASVLFDVLANKNSPYRSLSLLGTVSGEVIPIFRAGINIMLSDLKKK